MPLGQSLSEKPILAAYALSNLNTLGRLHQQIDNILKMKVVAIYFRQIEFFFATFDFFSHLATIAIGSGGPVMVT